MIEIRVPLILMAFPLGSIREFSIGIDSSAMIDSTIDFWRRLERRLTLATTGTMIDFDDDWNDD